MKNQRQIGMKYERIAGEYLQTQGYEILEYNFHCRYGEIDIVAKQGEYLVFIEVKYRSSERYGAPLEAVTKGKQRTISKCAQSYLYKNRMWDIPIRFDVVGMSEKEIEVIRDAFSYVR